MVGTGQQSTTAFENEQTQKTNSQEATMAKLVESVGDILAERVQTECQRHKNLAATTTTTASDIRTSGQFGALGGGTAHRLRLHARLNL